MSGCESRGVVFVGADGFPIELEPTVNLVNEEI